MIEENIEEVVLSDIETMELDSIFFKNKEDKFDFDNIKSKFWKRF